MAFRQSAGRPVSFRLQLLEMSSVDFIRNIAFRLSGFYRLILPLRPMYVE